MSAIKDVLITPTVPESNSSSHNKIKEEDPDLITIPDTLNKNDEHIASQLNLILKEISLLKDVLISPTVQESNCSPQHTILPHKELDNILSLPPIATDDDQSITSQLKNILDNQATIIHNQNLIMQHFKMAETIENQKAIIHQEAKLQITAKSPTSCQTSSSSKTICQDIISDFKIIDNLEEFNNLEEKLSSKNEMNSYVRKLKFILAKIGNKYGFINCYILMDKFFSRKFICLCSWAGDGPNNTKKIPFKMYRNTINLFFKLIHLSDNNFTLTECEQFFKTIIHSSNRNQRSMISKIKQRLK